MQGSVEERVIEIIAEQAVLDAKNVAPEYTLGQLGIDSLGLAEIIFGIEENFDIQIDFNANEPGKGIFEDADIASIARAVENLVAQKFG